MAKLIITVVVIAFAVWGYTNFDERSEIGSLLVLEPVQVWPDIPVSSVEPALVEAGAKTAGLAQELEEKEIDDASGVFNIGEPLDPDDPSTWLQSASIEVFNIGEPLDPDDPSTWPRSESTEVINIGPPMDPDDPSNWPQSESAEVINIGPPMDPDDPSTWP